MIAAHPIENGTRNSAALCSSLWMGGLSSGILFTRVYSQCFLFGETMLDKGTGQKTWVERGVGEVKMLKHKEFGKIRLLMRQDKTMKIVINHVIDPRIKLEPNAGSDRSWVWSAFDFSEVSADATRAHIYIYMQGHSCGVNAHVV